MEAELSFADNLVIEFIPPSQCGELWSRKLGKRTEVEPSNDKIKKIACNQGENGSIQGQVSTVSGFLEPHHCARILCQLSEKAEELGLS